MKLFVNSIISKVSFIESEKLQLLLAVGSDLLMAIVANVYLNCIIFYLLFVPVQVK